MSEIDRPSVSALCASICNWNSGVSSWPLGRTATRRGSCESVPSSWLRACISAAWPRLARSCSIRSKPVALPSSATAGGAKAKTRASRMVAKNPKALATTPLTLSASPLRSFHGRSLTKAKPMFWPLPAKLKPATENTPLTASFWSTRKWCSTWRSTSSVRALVAPGGSCASTNSVPWSSSGRKPTGSFMKPTTTMANSTPYMAM